MTENKERDGERKPGWHPQELPTIMSKGMIVGWVVALVATACAFYQKHMNGSAVGFIACLGVASVAFLAIFIQWLLNQRK
ncbi:MAG: hypothetical protein JXR97_05795 [Planctomycetes bacterium]|nr:hypothetical protein [Planctomycetota bacterium]